MNEKANRSKLLVAVAVIALAFCMCMAAVPSDVDGDVSVAEGTTGPILSYQIGEADAVPVEATGIVEAMAAINGAAENVTVEILQDFSLDLAAVSTDSAGLWFNNSNADVVITINGNDHTISVADGTYQDSVNAIGFGAGTANVSDLIIDGNEVAHHGINIYGASTTVNITNVSSINNVASGITVNYATVTATGITASGNGWGAVNVDNGATFTLAEPETGSNDLGSGFQIWSEDNSTITAEGYETYGWGKDASASGTIFIENGTIEGDFTLPAGDYISIHADKKLIIAEDAGVIIEGSLSIAENGSIENNGTIELRQDSDSGQSPSFSMYGFDQITGNGSIIASPDQITISGTTGGAGPSEDDFGVVVATRNVYSGQAQEPNVRVVGPSNVTNIAVYDDTIEPQTDVGTYSASVTITFSYIPDGQPGEQSYTGRITFDFQWSIYACDLNDVNIADIPIQGITEQTPGPFTPALDIDNNGIDLVENVDYTVSYIDNDKAGVGTAIITGIGNYTGTVEKTFYIIDYQGYINDLEQFIGGDQGLGKEVPGAEPMTYAQIPAINDAITAAYNALYSATDPDTLEATMDDAKMNIVVAAKNTIRDFLATVYNNGQGYMGKVMTEEQYNAALETIGPDVYLPKDIINAYENALEARTDFDYTSYIEQLEQFIGGDQGLGKEVPGAEPMTYAQIPAINDAITAAYAGIYAAGDTNSVQNALEEGEMNIVVATKNTIRDFLATVYNNGQGYMGWMMTETQYNAALQAIGPDGTYLPADTIRVYENALEAREECYSITYMVGENLYLYQGGALNDFKAIVGCTVVPDGMEFVAWNVEGTDIFYMPGDMIELGVDTNMWGDDRTIVLNAVYSNGSEDPENPEVVYSDDIVVSIHYDVNNRVVVSITAVDGGCIPSGTLTVSGSYVVSEMDPILGVPIDTTYAFSADINIPEGSTNYVFTADEYDFVNGMISIGATFSYGDVTINSNSMSFDYVPYEA